MSRLQHSLDIRNMRRTDMATTFPRRLVICGGSLFAAFAEAEAVAAAGDQG